MLQIVALWRIKMVEGDLALTTVYIHGCTIQILTFHILQASCTWYITTRTVDWNLPESGCIPNCHSNEHCIEYNNTALISWLNNEIHSIISPLPELQGSCDLICFLAQVGKSNRVKTKYQVLIVILTCTGKVTQRYKFARHPSYIHSFTSCQSINAEYSWQVVPIASPEIE